MKHPWISIAREAPPEFSFRSELSTRDVRISAFALFADSLEQAETALRPFIGKAGGIIVTFGDTLAWEDRDEGIRHLALPPPMRPFLREILELQLSAMQTVLDLTDAGRQQALSLARASDDRNRMVREFADLRESLLKEIGERRRAQEQLQKAHDQLEIRVKERTAELATANESLQQALSDLSRSHEDLKAAQLQLIQAEKMHSVGLLAAGVAHEVKNPLQIIAMGIDFLASEGTVDADTLGIVIGEIKEAISRADQVISGLLDYSASKELDIHPGNLNALVDRVLGFVKHQVIRGKIDIVRQLDPDLPPCPLDANKIEQVLIILLENACSATPENGTVTVATFSPSLEAQKLPWDPGNRSGTRARQHGHVVVEITDSGPGITPENLKRIFDPFFTTKPTGKGTGLGLTVALKIVELHGGTLEIANGQNGGATARLTLPL